MDDDVRQIDIANDRDFIYIRDVRVGSDLSTEIQIPINAADAIAAWIREAGQGHRQMHVNVTRAAGLRWGRAPIRLRPSPIPHSPA
jgi:hypothetical protein